MKQNFKFFIVLAMMVAISTVGWTQSNYDAKELADLRAFLRQESADPGVANVMKFGLTEQDTIEWTKSTNWLDRLRIQWIEIDGVQHVEDVSWFFYGLSGNFSLPNCTYLKKVNLSMNPIKSIEIANNKMLVELTLSNTSITGLDVTQNKNLESLTIANTQLAEIDLSQNGSLKSVDISNTQICEVNLLNNPGLEYLYCMSCPELISLSFSNNLSLLSINCGSSPKLKSLDLAHLGNLEWLICNRTGLEELDLRANLKLNHLQCQESRLQNLFLPDNSQLSLLYCYGNQLQEISGLENLHKIQELRTQDNKLSTLNLTNAINLSVLYCGGNQLKQIDGLASLTGLSLLDCSNNKIESLKELNSKGLKELYAEGNRLRISTMPSTESISKYRFYPQDTIKMGVVKVGGTIDFSSECVRIENETEKVTRFEWFELSDGKEMPVELTVSENGIFTVSDNLSGKDLRCKMYNGWFTELIGQEVTECPFVYEIHVSGDERYAESEINQLKSFLRQESLVKGKINADLLGIDTLKWSDNQWIYGVEGLKTEIVDQVVHVKSITWVDKSVSGMLDLSNFQQLENLDISGNGITLLKLESCEKLVAVNCADNNLRFSTIPDVAESVAIVIAPQKIWDGGNKSAGESIDLSSEYTIGRNGELWNTVYAWYEIQGENKIPFSLEQQENGVFSLSEEMTGKTLLCEMTNEAFGKSDSSEQLVLQYRVKITSSVGNDYSQTEINQLIEFLKQPSAVYANDGTYNYEQLGLTVTDTIGWKQSYDWVLKLQNVDWEEFDGVMYLAHIDWAQKNLGGEFCLCSTERLKTVNVQDNDLTKVRLEDCISLTGVQTYNNLKCTELDLRGCRNLEEVHAQNCALSMLDLSLCSRLSSLYAFNNQLTSFNAEDMIGLKSVYLHHNLLDSVNFKACTGLVDLDLSFNKLICLDLSACENLSFLKCSDNYLTFETLPKKDFFSYQFAPQAMIKGTPVEYTEGIDLSSLYTVQFPDEEPVKTSYEWYDITSGTEVVISAEGIQDQGNGIFAISSDYSGSDLRCKMTNQKFPGLLLVYEVELSENLDNYDEAEIGDLRNFLRQPSQHENISNAMALGLTESDTLDWNTSSKWLVRLTSLKKLTWESVKNEHKNETKRLKEIYFGSSALAGTLSLKNCLNLKSLDCYTNSLSALELPASCGLTYINCVNNKFSEIDFSMCPNLETVTCYGNKIKKLEFRNHSNLEYLKCFGNGLEQLDVTGCEKLFTLHCHENNLTTLDLTHNRGLVELICSDNKFKTLDLSQNPELCYFDGHNNSFTDFDFSSYNKKLYTLILDHNLLKRIVLTDLVIETVNISYNKLTFSTIPFDFWRKHYYFAPQDTVDMGSIPCDATLDISSEYMLDEDGTHTYYEWVEMVGDDEFIPTDKVITVDERGIFKFTKEAENKRFKCILTNDGDYRSALTMEYYVNVVKPSSLDAVDKKISILVGPNPCVDRLVVNSTSQIGKVEVFDANANLIRLIDNVEIENLEINVEGWSSGLYFVRVSDNVVKVIKL